MLALRRWESVGFAFLRSDEREDEGGTVRTMTNERGETFFVGKDVAKSLWYKNPAKALRDYVDEEDKQSERIVLSGQRRNVILINESGLHVLILSSKLKEGRLSFFLLQARYGQQQFFFVLNYVKSLAYLT